MNRVVLSKEERQAKKSWQRKLGTRVDVQTYASKSFKRVQQDGSRFHPNDESRSWLAERGSRANNAREEDQKDIAAKMLRKDEICVPSTTSYRVRVRNTGTPEGRLPTTRVIITGLGLGGAGVPLTWRIWCCRWRCTRVTSAQARRVRRRWFRRRYQRSTRRW